MGNRELHVYERWLRKRGVWWHPNIRLVSPSDADATSIAHGWGVIALAPVGRGEIAFRVPKKACFGVREGARGAGGEARPEEEVDSQAVIICALLRERALGSASEWAPFLSTLPTDVLTPWRWACHEQQWLRGTELERPLARKLARLRTEHALASAAGRCAGASFETWSQCCACVISHVNPWWGTCIAPFACMLNAADEVAGEKPGVAYELARDGRTLIGTTLRALRAGEEVTQSYGDGICVSDLIYRYGFCFPLSAAAHPPALAEGPDGASADASYRVAPGEASARSARETARRRSDIVSVRLRELSQFCEAIRSDPQWLEATSALSDEAAATHKRPRAMQQARSAEALSPGEQHDDAGSRGQEHDAGSPGEEHGSLDELLVQRARALPSTFDARAELLERACVLQPCPWDGLEQELSIELGLSVDVAIDATTGAAANCAGSGAAFQKMRRRWRDGAHPPATPPGLPELLVACDVLFGLGEGEWERVRGHVAACSDSADAQQPQPNPTPYESGFDSTDRTALALAAAISSLRAGVWPPARSVELELAAKLARARAGRGLEGRPDEDGSGMDTDDDDEQSAESEEDEEEDEEDDDDDDQPLWEVLARYEPTAATPGLAFASPVAMRAAQALIERLRYRKFAAIPHDMDVATHPLTPMMAETLHQVELLILHACALLLDFHSGRLLSRLGRAPPRPADDPCAAWRRLQVLR
jgi:hypothetical protein